MFLILVGPKGSGKSYIGRILQRHLGVYFFHVEPLWMAYHAQCRASGSEPSIPEGILTVHPKIKEALSIHEHVCVETTGASPEILNGLLSLSSSEMTLTVRITAPLNVCLQRIATRDQTNQIPLDIDTIKKVYGLSSSLEMPAAIRLENFSLSEAEIVSAVSAAMLKHCGGRRRAP